MQIREGIESVSALFFSHLGRGAGQLAHKK